MECTEVNARLSAANECMLIMKKNSVFTILSHLNRELICDAIADDVNHYENSIENTCAFVVVSTFNSFNDFYRGLESELALWQI